jgi:MbtH protein
VLLPDGAEKCHAACRIRMATNVIFVPIRPADLMKTFALDTLGLAVQPSIQIFQMRNAMFEDNDDETTYHVVLNHEEQYSIWPVDRDIPLGWRAEGRSGSKEECLAYIDEVWTDMRPLSLRKQMDAAQAEAPGKDAI